MSVSNVETLLTVAEVLERLRLSRSKLHELVRRGQLKAVKFGRRTLFRAAAVQELIEASECQAERASANVRGLG